MTFEEIEVGKIYTHNDDGLYKILDKGLNYVIVLIYEQSHYVATVSIWSSEEQFYYDSLNEITDSYYYDLFNDLVYYNDSQLKDIR